MKKNQFLTVLFAVLIFLPAWAQEVNKDVGKRIVLSTNRKPIYMFMQQPSSSTSESMQGATVYGNILFQFHNNNLIADVIDMATQTKIQEMSYVETTTNHANNACFGMEKFAQTDYFPLLYLSRNKVNGIYVYRITGTRGNYRMQQVQKIDVTCSKGSYYYTDCMVDTVGGCIWLNGYLQSNWTSDDGSGNNLVKYAKVRLPKLAEGDVTLDAGVALQQFTIPWTYATQGSMFYNGRIHQMFGITGSTNMYRLINPETEKIEKVVYPWHFEMDKEPESIFVYNGEILFSTIQGEIYRVSDFDQ